MILSIQLRIVSLLGSLGGDSKFIMSNTTTEESKLVAWDTHKFLKFNIPFQDLNAEIYLDNLLPRIIELAENSSNRKTRVSACELLHSLTVYMIGKSATRAKDETDGIKKSPYHKLYTRVFPSLLRLASDVETVSRDLFRPLLFQIIHWLTRNSRFENPETMALLDSCLVAVSENDGPVPLYTHV